MADDGDGVVGSLELRAASGLFWLRRDESKFKPVFSSSRHRSQLVFNAPSRLSSITSISRSSPFLNPRLSCSSCTSVLVKLWRVMNSHAAVTTSRLDGSPKHMLVNPPGRPLPVDSWHAWHSLRPSSISRRSLATSVFSFEMAEDRKRRQESRRDSSGIDLSSRANNHELI